MFKRGFIISLVLLNVTLAQASAPALVKKAQKSNKNLSTAVQIGVAQRSLTLATEKAPADQDVDIKPNTPSSGSIGIANRTLGLSASWNFGESSKNTEKVKTRATDYQLRYFKKQLAVELLYQDYKGFNLDQKSDKASSFISAKESVLENFQVELKQAQLTWTLRGENVLDVFGITWEKPTRDGSSILITGGYSEISFSNPVPFLPQGTNAFGSDNQIKTGYFKSLSVGPGYLHVWQWDRFYFVLLAFFQIGVQEQSYSLASTSVQNTKSYWSPNLKAAMTYDWDSYYISLIAHIHRTTLNLGDSTLAVFSNENSINIGARF